MNYARSLTRISLRSIGARRFSRCPCVINQSPNMYFGQGIPQASLFHKKVQNPFLTVTSHRYFFRMLNAVFNRPDRNRIKEVGAERACAEWLLRCGAQVRWVGSTRFFTDYNSLPQSTSTFSNHIEEINCDEAAVMDIGFEHLEGLKHVKKVRFNHCPYLEDEAISQLVRIKDSLEVIEIISCGDLTERSLSTFSELQNLKTLYMRDLPNVRDKTGIYAYLQKALPRCKITFEDIQKLSE